MPLGQSERAWQYRNRNKAFKYLLSLQIFEDKDADDPRNFLADKLVIKVTRTGSGFWQT